jgi:hypothetical protein
MKGIEKGHLLSARTYSFTADDGKAVSGGIVILGVDDVPDNDPSNWGLRVETMSCDAATADALLRAGLKKFAPVEVECELRPGMKKPRALSVRGA